MYGSRVADVGQAELLESLKGTFWGRIEGGSGRLDWEGVL